MKRELPDFFCRMWKSCHLGGFRQTQKRIPGRHSFHLNGFFYFPKFSLPAKSPFDAWPGRRGDAASDHNSITHGAHKKAIPMDFPNRLSYNGKEATLTCERSIIERVEPKRRSLHRNGLVSVDDDRSSQPASQPASYPLKQRLTRQTFKAVSTVFIRAQHSCMSLECRWRILEEPWGPSK